jgi:hypothetical protein
MGSYISYLQSASTASDLKSAVDYLPQKREYYTTEIRDLLIAKKNLIVDAETAVSVVKFLSSFSRSESARHLLRTKEVQNLIINHVALHVTAIEEFGSFICDIVEDQKTSVLFANVESFSAILKCFHRSKTSNDAREIASSIECIIFLNPSSNKLLNSLPVVEAFSFIIPLANNAQAVQSILNALQKILNNNEEAQQKFATPDFVKKFQGMRKHVKLRDLMRLQKSILFLLTPTDLLEAFVGSASAQQLSSAVDFLQLNKKYYTEEIRDLLIAKKDLIVDAATADSVVCFFESFSAVNSLRPLLRTKEVQNFIINHVALHVTAIEEFGRLIRNIVQNQQSAEFFANAESFSAILKCFHRSKTSDDATEIASSIHIILNYKPSSNELLNSLPVVEAFSSIIPLAKDACAVEWISKTLNKILDNNEEAQQKFAAPEFMKIVKGMEKFATTDDSRGSLKIATDAFQLIILRKFLESSISPHELRSAVVSLPHNEKYFTSRVRDLLIAKKDLIVDSETADSVAKFLFSFSNDESLRRLLQTKEVRDLIINNIAPHVTAIEEFGEMICSIVQDQQSAEFFANIESFSAILKCFHRSKTSKDAREIASSINYILKKKPSSNKLLKSLPVVESFSFIIPLANETGAVYCISNTLNKILENNEEAQQKFAAPEFVKIFQGMEKFATEFFLKAAVTSIVDILVGQPQIIHPGGAVSRSSAPQVKSRNSSNILAVDEEFLNSIFIKGASRASNKNTTIHSYNNNSNNKTTENYANKLCSLS